MNLGRPVALALGDALWAQQIARWLADEGIAHVAWSPDSTSSTSDLAALLVDCTFLRTWPGPLGIEPGLTGAEPRPMLVVGERDSLSDRQLAAARGAGKFMALPLERAALLRALRSSMPAAPSVAVMFGPAGSGLSQHAGTLAGQGIEVHVVHDADRLFARLAAIRPDVLVLFEGSADAPVPAIAHLVRQDDAWDDLLLIAVLADAAASHDLPPGTAVLPAPARPADLLGTVARHTRRRPPARVTTLHDLLSMQDQERRALDAHALVSIADSNGNIVYANDHFCSTSGYRRDELLGRNHRIVKSGHHAPEIYADLWRTIGGGQIWQGELCNRRKDGSLYWVATTIMPMGGSGGANHRYLSIRSDITSLKGTQLSLRRRMRQQQMLASLSQHLMACDQGTLIGLLPAVVRRSARLLDATRASLCLLGASEHGRALEVEWPVEHPPDTAEREARAAPLEVPIGRHPDAAGFLRWHCTHPPGTSASHDLAFAQALAGMLAGAWARTSAELSQQESELALKGMLTAFPGIVAASTGDGIYEFVNDRFATLFGLQPGQIVGRSHAALLSPTQLRELDRRNQAIDRGSGPVIFEHSLPAAGGSPDRHFATVHFATGGGSARRRYFQIGVDITERRHMEERLQHLMAQIHAEGRLQGLIASMATELGSARSADIDEKIRHVLRAMGDHFDVDHAGLFLFADGWATLTNAHQWRAEHTSAQQSMPTSFPVNAIPWLQRQTRELGLAVHVPNVASMPAEAASEQALWQGLGVKSFLSIPVLGDGTARGLIGLAAVRGARCWSDSEIRALGILGQVVSNALHRVDVEQALLTLKDRAEAASAAKSDFLASMSHELRTPMNAVLGFGQLLELDLAGDARRLGHVQEILKGGRHLLSLIDDILDLARIESGRVELSLQPMQLIELVEECQRLTQPLADRRGIGMSVAVCPQAVIADRRRLRQVLVNLLSNAIKYNVDQGHIDIAALVVAGHRVRLSVRDTGAGIALDRQAELFQAFNRLGAEVGPVEGTGIGLVIVRRLVDAMGGTVGFSSAPGRGSTFWIELPAVGAGPVASLAPGAQACGTGAPSAPSSVGC